MDPKAIDPWPQRQHFRHLVDAAASCTLALGKPKAFRVGYPSGNAFDGATLAIMPTAP